MKREGIPMPEKYKEGLEDMRNEKIRRRIR